MNASLALLEGHRPGDLVAFGESGDRTASDLLADAAQIADVLPASSEGSQVLLVFERDRYEMAACFLAAISKGHAVALPPTTRPDAVMAVLERPESVALLHDTDGGFDHRAGDLLAQKKSLPPLATPFIPHAGAIATVFTSGSTGPMTAWPKTSSQLLGEAAWLNRTFAMGADDRFVGTIAPGHIYGLLFTVLSPLMCGAAFSRETPHHAGAVARCIADGGGTVLVTVPAQLRSFEALERGSFEGVRRVFSSTGPLPDPVAKDFFTRHAIPITEILGSTETGGMASRERRDQGEGRWTPFDVVRVSVDADDRMRVESPFLHPDGPKRFETADRIELDSSGTFAHLGRVDGIVKIGGRRVSIADVEACLQEQPGVDEAAVLAVPMSDVRGMQLLAVVSPSSCVPADLRAGLLERFEPTCIPRRLLAVDSLPTGVSEKVPREKLLRLFRLREDGSPLNDTLEWSEERRLDDKKGERFEFEISVPEDYGWFVGHFDGYPVLAGAVQLKEIVLPASLRVFPDLESVSSMNRVKFSGRITRGARLILRLTRVNETNRVRFEIRDADHGKIQSVGTLAFVRKTGL